MSPFVGLRHTLRTWDSKLTHVYYRRIYTSLSGTRSLRASHKLPLPSKGRMAVLEILWTSVYLRPILTFSGPRSISVACRRWRRQPFCVGVPGTWNSVSRDTGNRRESGALVGVAVTGGGHRRTRRSPERAAISGVVRRRRRREGTTLIWIKRCGHKTVSDDGWRRRGRRRSPRTLVLVGGHAIRTGSIFLIIIYHAISVPLTIIGTVGIYSPSRRRGWQRGGRVTWRYMAKATSHVTRWRRLVPISWIPRGPIAPTVWGRRGVVLPFVVSGAALWNLDMDAFPWNKRKKKKS